MIPDLQLIQQLVKEAVSLGAAAVLKELQPKKDDISQSKAELEFGEADIRRLIKQNIVTRRKIGARYYLSRKEISEVLCQSSFQLLAIRMQNGEQQTVYKSRVGRILGHRRQTRKA